MGTGIFFAVGSGFADPNWTIVLSLAGQYAGNLGVFWLIARYKAVSELGWSISPGDLLYVGLGLVLQIGLAIAFLPLSEMLFPDGRPQQEVADIIANADATWLKVALVVAAVVLGPITEELMYRGVLLRALERWGKWLAVVVSSMVFAVAHLTGLDQQQLLRSAAVFMPPLFILGLILARLTQRTGRLGPAIFLHSGWNLLSAFVLLLPTDILEQVG